MTTMLLRDAELIATFDDRDREIAGGSILVRDNSIEAIGPASAVTHDADVTIDCSGMLLTPGLINTHHHFTQTLTRSIPAVQDADLFEWLQRLYPIWLRITSQALQVSTRTAIAELLLSGCTTSADHTYMWPNGTRIDDQIQVAREMGFRFHAGRGSMSLGASSGGLPPDEAVEDERAILNDSQRVIDAYHDQSRFAMTRVVLAPCSPFSVSAQLMRETAALARAGGVYLHTHLAETVDEERFCLERFGRRPVELAEELGWIGPDVWHAHAVHVSNQEVARLGASHTGIAHCPTSNMRLGSGIAPVRQMLQAGARVGLGVDGSASNDCSNLLDEARHAMLLQRVNRAASVLSAREVFALATRGGARVLGRDDIGVLAPNMAADIAGWSTRSLELAGAAVHDPLASVIFCRPRNADLVIVNGRVRVRRGELLGFDLPAHVATHNQIARRLVLRDS